MATSRAAGISPTRAYTVGVVAAERGLTAALSRLQDALISIFERIIPERVS
jgi:hypothetical protein